MNSLVQILPNAAELVEELPLQIFFGASLALCQIYADVFITTRNYVLHINWLYCMTYLATIQDMIVVIVFKPI